MVIDHIGITVRNIEKGREHWEKTFGYKAVTEVVINSRQQVKVQFLEKENSPTVKLVEPLSPESPAASSLKQGGGLHHLCFRCEDMDAGLEEFKEKGLRLLSPPEPGEAFDNEKIAFLYGKQGLNIELIDTEKRAKRIE